MSQRVSVIMPVLNGEAHLAAALASALAQLGPDDEIVLIDNGSTDRSVGIARAAGDARIRIEHQPAPGPSAARNRGLAVARGDFIAFLDHDDLWPPGRQQALIQALDRHPDADAAIGRLRLQFDAGVDERFNIVDGRHPHWIYLGAYLFRRAVIDRNGAFDETLRFGEDVDYFVRLLDASMKAVEVDWETSIYRRHHANMTLDIKQSNAGFLRALRLRVLRDRR